MKTGTYFKQRANTAINPCPAIGRSRDSREDLQKCAFARSVAPDNPKYFAAFNLEGDVAKSPEATRMIGDRL